MSTAVDSLHLASGTLLLNGQYTIISVLGQGGFGITYSVSQHGVPFARAVKECFPTELAERRNGMVVPRSPDRAKLLALCIKTFQDEVTHLAKLSHPAIVPVMQVFPENGTVYMVLDFVAGKTLEAHLTDQGGTLPEAEIIGLLRPILEALEMLHAEDILHRDIAPDNIVIKPDGAPVLIDFGAAREVIREGTRHTTGLRSVKDGYSPHEFYVRGARQGQQSDLYSLAATMYRAISGKPPPSAELRAHALASGEPDPIVPLVGSVSGYDPTFLGLIDGGLSHRFAARPADVFSWRERLGWGEPRLKEALIRIDEKQSIRKNMPEDQEPSITTDGIKKRKSYLSSNSAILLLAVTVGLAVLIYAYSKFGSIPFQSADDPQVQPKPTTEVEVSIEDMAVDPVVPEELDEPPLVNSEPPQAPVVFEFANDAAPPLTPNSSTEGHEEAIPTSPGSVAPVIPDLPLPDAAIEAVDPPPPLYSGTQEELVRALQTALDTHNCRPGPIDGSYGLRSERAGILFNLVAPRTCERLDLLEVIGRTEPAPDWRTSAVANLQALENCAPIPACGTPPTPDFYRDFAKGCWHENFGAHPNEYATWEGECDTEGYISGVGTLTYRYPVAGPGSDFLTRKGSFEKGRANGEFVETQVDGSQIRSTYKSGVLDGFYQITSNAWVEYGHYREGRKDGEWTLRGPRGYLGEVVYQSGVAINGKIRFANDQDGFYAIYEGEIKGRYMMHGNGTETAYNNTNKLITRTGRWYEHSRVGRWEETWFNGDGTVLELFCVEKTEQGGRKIVALSPGERCIE